MRNERRQIRIKPSRLIGTESIGLINRVSRKLVDGERLTVVGYRLSAVIGNPANRRLKTEHRKRKRGGD